MMAKNIKDDPGDNFDNMDIPAVNFFVTQPALHYALSWWKFWLFEGLMHHITNNHKLPTNQSYQSAWMQTYELSRPAGSGRASNQPIIKSIKQPRDQTTNKSNNQQISQSNLPEYRHLNCPGLQGGVGQDDGSSLPSMQSVDPSQYLGFHYNNEEVIKISKI